MVLSSSCLPVALNGWFSFSEPCWEYSCSMHLKNCYYDVTVWQICVNALTTPLHCQYWHIICFLICRILTYCMLLPALSMRCQVHQMLELMPFLNFRNYIFMYTWVFTLPLNYFFVFFYSNTVKIKIRFKNVFYFNISLNIIYSCDGKLNFQHRDSTLQCHMILQKSLLIWCSRNNYDY